MQSARSLTVPAVVVLAMLTGNRMLAQSVPAFPAGHHEYLIRGMYQGEPMVPWNVEFTLSDTTIAGTRAWTLVNEVHQATGSTFHLSATWKLRLDDSLEASWINGGREPNSCQLTRAAGRITGSITPGGPVDAVPVDANAIPDFAAGAYVATQPLSDGDVIRLTVFRCLPHFGAKAIVVKQLFASVRSDSLARLDGFRLEPVWVIEGAPNYPMVIRIAKGDRQLLTFLIPEGDVGQQTAYYRGTRY